MILSTSDTENFKHVDLIASMPARVKIVKQIILGSAKQGQDEAAVMLAQLACYSCFGSRWSCF